IRCEVVRHARAPDPGNAAEHLDLVVEDGRSEVLDGVRTHDELPAVLAVVQQAEPAQVLDPGEVEVRVVTAVVDDALRVRVREPNARPCRELERWLSALPGHSLSL